MSDHCMRDKKEKERRERAVDDAPSVERKRQDRYSSDDSDVSLVTGIELNIKKLAIKKEMAGLRDLAKQKEDDYIKDKEIAAREMMVHEELTRKEEDSNLIARKEVEEVVEVNIELKKTDDPESTSLDINIANDLNTSNDDEDQTL